MRVNLVLAVVFLLLAGGCSGPTKVNHPPEVRLFMSPTEGEAPLNVTFRVEYSDEDGDDLQYEEHQYDDGTLRGGGGWSNSTGVPGYPTKSSIKGWSVYDSGTHTVVIRVSDGKAAAEASATVHVTCHGMSCLGIIDSDFMAWANLTAACPACTGVGREEPTGRGAPGGEACQGFLSNKNETDCAWFPVPPAWVNKSFFVKSPTPAKLMVSLRDDCTPGAFKNRHMYLDPSPSSSNGGTIPADTGCILFWSHDKAPVRVRFVIV